MTRQKFYTLGRSRYGNFIHENSPFDFSTTKKNKTFKADEQCGELVCRKVPFQRENSGVTGGGSGTPWKISMVVSGSHKRW